MVNINFWGVVLLVMAFDWGLGYVLTKKKKQKQRKVDEKLSGDLNKIINDLEVSKWDRKNKALELCRNTPGDFAAGAYSVLESRRIWVE